MASDPSSTSSTPAGSPNSSWSADPDVLKTLVGLLSSSVDPFANHSEVYRQLQQLQAHLQGDFELYLVFLMAQWNNPGLRVEVCQAAGLLLKQSVKSKYKDGVSESAKGFVKGALLNMFLQTDGNGQYKSKAVQNTLGALISTIVGFEGLSKWPDLLSKMMAQLGGREGGSGSLPAGLRLRQLEETLDFLFMILEEHAESAAVCQEVAELCRQFDLGNALLKKASEPKASIRVKALHCVYHILQILYLSHSVNTSKEVLGQQQLTQNTLNQLLVLTNDAEPEVKAAVCTGFVQILEVDAQLLQVHLENLMKYMLVMAQDEDILVAMEATGFWSAYIETIDYYCEDDFFGAPAPAPRRGDSFSSDCEYWLQLSLGELTRVLTSNMKFKQDDEDVISAEQIWDDIKANAHNPKMQAFQNTDVKPFHLRSTRGVPNGEEEEEEGNVVESWTLRKSSAGTLDTLAMHCGDSLLQYLMPIVIERLQNEDWSVRESAILALGAVITGCPGLEQHTLDVMKVVLPQLQQQQESQHPLLVTICCWTLSRFAGAIVTISSGSGEAGRDLYDQMHKSLLFNLRSLHPKVVESALSAVAVSIERSSFALLVQVLDPTIEEMRGALDRRQMLSERNLILVFDLVATLCQRVMKEEEAMLLFCDQRYLALVAGPLMDLLYSYQAQKFGDVVFLNLVQSLTWCLGAFGQAVESHSQQLVTFCIQVCQVCVSSGESEKSLYTISAILGLMAAVMHFPSSVQVLMGQNQEFFGFLCSCLHSTSPDVKQAAFSLCGSLLSHDVGQNPAEVVSELSKNVVQAGLLSLHKAVPDHGRDAKASLTEAALDEVNNALWCLCKAGKSMDGQTAVTVLGLVTPYLERTSGFPRMIVENATILIGCMAKTHSEAFAQYADHFFWSWAVALATLRDSDEKKDAFVGLFYVLQAREDVGRRHFPQVANAVASWHKDPPLLLRGMLAYYKDELGKLPGAVREKISVMFGL